MVMAVVMAVMMVVIEVDSHDTSGKLVKKLSKVEESSWSLKASKI